MWPFLQLRRKRKLRSFQLPETDWRQVLAEHPILLDLSEEEMDRLREMAILFIHEKIFEPVKGLQLPQERRLAIAALCCLPVLNLGLDWLDGWRTVIVYPGEFIRRREQFDDSGVMHEWEEILSGEAWHLGPLILSWADLEASGLGEGYNVAIHEIAHKLDLLNGEVDGFPPLHRSMGRGEWTRTFTAAFDELNRSLDEGRETDIDPYAAEEPGEFFAVLSEYFFELPDLVNDEYPDIYRLLVDFYRQYPLKRMKRANPA